ncbi:MAG TPA: radical SAM protein [Bacteroidetes bacterium]|nr:radical SAM protein [Bacteroidota bacterium]
MFDQYNRHITYLRISVTDRCNLRCTYCMPAEGVQLLRHSDILTFDEIFEFTQTAVAMGVNKVRITGGEPLVRKGIIDLVAMLSKIDGITDLSMTTNAVLLKQFAKPLFDAGLMRVNVSLDTLNPDKFRQITRFGELSDVLEGIDAARQAGLTPIKLNCVVKESSNEPDAILVKQFAQQNGFIARFIPLMDLGSGIHGIVEGGEGGDCINCNRLRLTANGIVKPCLFSDIGYNVRELGARQAIINAVENKPACGGISTLGEFYNIGG